MARKTKHQKAKRTRMHRGVMVLCVVFAFMMIGISSFISAGMAVSVAGVLAVISFGLFEKRRRGFWENALQFKIDHLREDQDKITRDVFRNRRDIDRIKTSGAVAHKEKPRAPSPRSGKKFKAILDEAAHSISASKPRAVRPAKLQNNAPSRASRAHDEETEYYNAISDTVVTELLRHAIRAQNITVFMQPIMRLPQRSIRFFELFARIRVKPGIYLPAARYMDLAKKERLLNDIDELLLMQCLEKLKTEDMRGELAAYFLNVSTATLKNTDFMRRLLRFISLNRALAPRLVFEMHQRDFDEMPPALQEILRGLGTLGCNFSIDHITHYKFDIARLNDLNVRFVKFEASALMQRASSEKGARDVWAMKRAIEAQGIGFIAEKIEDEHTLRELMDFDVRYAQGHLLGKPAIPGAYKKSNAAKHIREARRINAQGRRG